MENITDLHEEYSEEYPLIQGFREVGYIDWLEFRLMEAKQINLTMPIVSKQRELLINFLMWHDSENLGCLPDGIKSRVDEYLKLINCA